MARLLSFQFVHPPDGARPDQSDGIVKQTNEKRTCMANSWLAACNQLLAGPKNAISMHGDWVSLWVFGPKRSPAATPPCTNLFVFNSICFPHFILVSCVPRVLWPSVAAKVTQNSRTWRIRNTYVGTHFSTASHAFSQMQFAGPVPAARFVYRTSYNTAKKNGN